MKPIILQNITTLSTYLLIVLKFKVFLVVSFQDAENIFTGWLLSNRSTMIPVLRAMKSSQRFDNETLKPSNQVTGLPLSLRKALI